MNYVFKSRSGYMNYEISHTGTPVVISTHNHGLIDRFPGRVYKCEEGKLIEMTDKTNKENNK